METLTKTSEQAFIDFNQNYNKDLKTLQKFKTNLYDASFRDVVECDYSLVSNNIDIIENKYAVLYNLINENLDSENIEIMYKGLSKTIAALRKMINLIEKLRDSL